MAAERKRHCENIVLSAAKEQERLQAVDNISEADVKSCKDTSTWRFVSHFSIGNYELMNLYSGLLFWIVPNLVLTALHSRFNMSWEPFVNFRTCIGVTFIQLQELVVEIESLREQQDEGSISLTELAENFHRLDTSLLQQIPQCFDDFFFFP